MWKRKVEFKSKGNKALHLATIVPISFMHGQCVWNEHVMYASVCMWGLGTVDELGWKC